MERPFLERLKSAFADILTSKKVLMAITAAIVAGSAKYGLELDTEIVVLIISPLVAAILGQSVADIGKESAKVQARLGKPPDQVNIQQNVAAPPEQTHGT